MSGLAAIHRTDGRDVEAPLLWRMVDALPHRDADPGGVWIEGPVGLGHRAGATTAESPVEIQPTTGDAHACRLIWDGRIDNREELILALGGDGAVADPASDASLMLAAYRRWGMPSIERVIGEFAFVLWDRSCRRLLCARDRMGGRPLHYTWTGGTLVVSSEVKPLLAIRERMPEPDDEMVLAFLLREFREVDHHRTFFQGLHRLPPGHLLCLERAQARVERYGRIEAAGETRYARDEDYVERFAEIFREAVRCRLRSPFPVGATVSGGLDSSAVLCTAARLFECAREGSPPLEAFTLFSDDDGSDERRYVTDVTASIGIKTHELYVAPDDPLDGLASLTRDVESPIVSPHWRAGTVLMDALAHVGCRTLLTGDGGDELLDETGYLADLLRSWRFGRFLRETRTFADWYGGARREFMSMSLAQCLRPTLRFWAKRLARQAPPPWMNHDLGVAVGLHDRLRRPRHELQFPSLCQSETYLSVTSAYYLLKRELDARRAARSGIEARHPFLDSRLVEFVLSMPWTRRTRDGERKYLLRQSVHGLVPESVRTRRAKGDWTRRMDRSVTALCRRDPPAPLENRSGRMWRYVDPRGSAALVRCYLRGATAARNEVWFLITLDRWLEAFWGRND